LSYNHTHGESYACGLTQKSFENLSLWVIFNVYELRLNLLTIECRS